MNLVLTPAGHLIMTPLPDTVGSADAAYTVPTRAGELEQAFAGSQAAGIMALAGGKSAPDWPLSWQFWRDFGTRYLLLLCQTQPTSERLDLLPPPVTLILSIVHAQA